MILFSDRQKIIKEVIEEVEKIEKENPTKFKQPDLYITLACAKCETLFNKKAEEDKNKIYYLQAVNKEKDDKDIYPSAKGEIIHHDKECEECYHKTFEEADARATVVEEEYPLMEVEIVETSKGEK